MVKMLTKVEKADLTSLFISPERNPVPAEQPSIVSSYRDYYIYILSGGSRTSQSEVLGPVYTKR